MYVIVFLVFPFLYGYLCMSKKNNEQIRVEDKTGEKKLLKEKNK